MQSTGPSSPPRSSRAAVSRAKGCGQQKGFVEVFGGATEEVNLFLKVRLEIGVNDGFVEPTVEAIIKGARTGSIGDGKIFVLPIEECVKIRMGERGPCAIGGESEECSAQRNKNKPFVGCNSPRPVCSVGYN